MNWDAFGDFIRLGFEHIANFGAIDHLLFLVALCTVYRARDWGALLLVVTFFTLGHSITLSLAAFEVVQPGNDWIEFLIPITILLTASFNLSKGGLNPKDKRKYVLAGFFGLIHGLGFSGYYSMLTSGSGGYWTALFPFNLGIELGQLAIVIGVFLLGLVAEHVLRIKERDWNLFLSGGVFALALEMAWERIPF